MTGGVDVRRGADRFRTEQDGIITFHSFSYGRHYDPDNVGFGPVIALNEECIPAGGGYDAHQHADVRIFTLVVAGRLEHGDSAGRSEVVGPGQLRSVSAGEGMEHFERNASSTQPLRFLQVMTLDVPVYVRVLSLGSDRRESGAGPSLLHVIRGRLTLDGQTLGAGDEIRVEAGAAYDLSASEPADVLIVQAR